MTDGRGTSRRSFFGQIALGTAALSTARRAWGGPTAPPPGRDTASSATRPAGDLARRVELTARRLTETGVPAYTEDFVLADVTLDTARRFWEFSGDLSGRWIEALAALPPAGRSPAGLAPLVAKLLARQRTDGRFGRADLVFTPAEVGREHMALLWGNGRLLVGLVAFWEATRHAAALDAARRLAGFLLAVREAAVVPEVMARLAVSYEHSGFRGRLPLELRPMGETPADEQKTIAFWLNYRRAGSGLDP